MVQSLSASMFLEPCSSGQNAKTGRPAWRLRARPGRVGDLVARATKSPTRPGLARNRQAGLPVLAFCPELHGSRNIEAESDCTIAAEAAHRPVGARTRHAVLQRPRNRI